jgi:hypothetical protein
MNVLAALALAAGLAAQPEPLPAPAPADADASAPDLALPLRGAPEDLATWKAMREDLHQVQIQRGLAHRLYYRLRPEAETTRLAAIAREHPAENARVDALLRRLYPARKMQYDMMAAIWPVDPRRGCRAEMDDLKVAMEAGPGPEARKLLDSARVQARVCNEKLRSALGPLTQTNRELVAALADVDAYLATAPPVTLPAAAGAPTREAHAEHEKHGGQEEHDAREKHEHEARESAAARGKD